MAKSPFLLAAENGFDHWCPGCHQMHFICTDGVEAWEFNGNIKKPTFWPSMMIRSQTWNETTKKTVEMVCHYYITDGVIIFQADSTHALGAQRTQLPRLPVATYRPKHTHTVSKVPEPEPKQLPPPEEPPKEEPKDEGLPPTE